MPTLINESPLQALLLPGWTLDRRFQLTLIIKATCSFELNGELKLADEQPELVLADSYRDNPETSSLQQTAEVQPFKQNAEFYLFGKAYPRQSGDPVTSTCIQMQGADWNLEKKLLVLGAHQWQRGFSGITRSKVAPLEPLELQYELAYGGQNQKNGEGLPENPAGRGYNPSSWWMNDRRAPQIEYESTFQARLDRHNRPAGYGPLPINWLPRARRYGRPLTEQELNQQVCPWGENIHPQLHHAAPDDQQLPGFLQGGEQIHLTGFFADQTEAITLRLPDWSNQVHHIRQDTNVVLHQPVCDTLVLDTEQRQLSLIYRLGLPASRVLAEQDDGWLLIPEDFGPRFQERSDAS